MIHRVDYRADLADVAGLAQHLSQTGLSHDAAHAKAERFARANAALPPTQHAAPSGRLSAFFVPGRIEVLGKHTDYAGGRTIVVAVFRSTPRFA